MFASLKKLLLRFLAILSEIIVYKEGVTSTETSRDGWAEYLYDTTLGMSNLNRYIWIAYNKEWNVRPEVQEASSNKIILRTWTLSTPSASSVTLQRNTHVTVNLLGILKPEYWRQSS